MNYEDLSFPLEVSRKSGIAELSIAAGDAARFGKPTKKEGVIEDNGLLVSLEKDVEAEEAADLLGEMYQNVRNSEVTEKNKGGSAAVASAMLTKDGVTVRSAGDSAVFVMGDNGKVKLLNEFHTVDENDKIAPIVKKYYMDKGVPEDEVDMTQVVVNCIGPRTKNFKKDFTHSFSWQDLESQLGTKNMRVLAVSDGLYGRMPEKLVAKHVERLLEGLDIDDPQFSRKVMRRTLRSETFMGKKDDVLILSAKRPEPNNTVLLHALDGVGEGRRASAEVAAESIEIAKNVMREHAVGAYLGEPDSELSSAELSGVNASRGSQRS